MKKKVIIIALFVFLNIRAQSYLGFYHDNYSGVQSVIFNPAFVVDSPFKANINFISASALANNDYFGVKATDLLKSDYDFNKDAKLFPSTSNNFLLNTDILGLSLMVNIAPKHAIAIFTRGRGFVNGVDLNGNWLSEIKNRINSPASFRFPNSNILVNGNTWGEVGLSYGAVLLSQKEHFIKAGLSLKYLKGIQKIYIKTDNFDFIYNKVSDTNLNLNTITTTGTLTYGGNQNLEYVLENYDNLKLDPNSRGFGADFGAVYEWRPKIKDLSKYKLRLGISLTDVGSLNFDDSLERKYSLNKTITETTYQDYSSFDDFIKKNYTSFTETKNDSRVSLPTATHLNADWNINNVFFLNINGDFGLGDKNKKDTNFIANTISLTPRYESKWVGVYLPINYMDYRGVLAGFGFRLGPLFVGSGSIITNLISDQSKGIDLHAGLQVPIYNGGLSRSDRDDDGIPDRKDECPDVAGLKENNGCPKKAIPTPKPLDTDNDGVIDKFDKCPNVAGPKDNNGCPFEDTDKDDVLDKDDKCPTVAGPKENNGCPWPDTDKDGVLDKDDKCPEIPGVIANNGCPEVKEIQPEVIKKINEYSKTILFDTGKSTIKKESSGSLDAIVAIMNEYKTVNFKIEGHTDSSGKPLSNLKLSKTRAAAVKKYLTDKGISETRLSSEGYGSKKPIVSNKTLKGRNLNRRVEINLVK